MLIQPTLNFLDMQICDKSREFVEFLPALEVRKIDKTLEITRGNQGLEIQNRACRLIMLAYDVTTGRHASSPLPMREAYSDKILDEFLWYGCRDLAIIWVISA